MPYSVIVCILSVQEHGNPSIALEDSLIDDHEIWHYSDFYWIMIRTVTFRTMAIRKHSQ